MYMHDRFYGYLTIRRHLSVHWQYIGVVIRHLWLLWTSFTRSGLKSSSTFLHSTLFGAAFKLGRHELLALRRLIAKSRNCALKENDFRNPRDVNGKTKDWITKRLLQLQLRHRNSPTDEPIEDGRPIDPITPLCGPTLSCLSFSLAEISMLKIS